MFCFALLWTAIENKTQTILGFRLCKNPLGTLNLERGVALFGLPMKDLLFRPSCFNPIYLDIVEKPNGNFFFPPPSPHCTFKGIHLEC